MARKTTSGGTRVMPHEAFEAAKFGGLVSRAQSLVLRTRKASALFLERELSVSYAMARRVLDRLERNGIVGPQKDRLSREVLKPKDYFSARKDLALPKKHTGRPTRAEQLLPAAKKAILQHRRASIGFLEEQFQISVTVAMQILELLEREGFVGPTVKRRPRPILAGGTTDIASGRPSKVQKLLQRARQLVLGSQKATIPYLRRQLHIGRRTAREILNILEQEGLVGPASRGGKREILERTTGSKKLRATETPNSFDLVRVERMITALGEENNLARILRALIDDSMELADLKAQLRKLAQK
ncbi:hypothetical protein HY417_04160 [Candidatus Kaiserbacteria bacterium]|nr:hypothetical protein [Candidatus Kaiserbacteria bacterium]